MRNTFRRGLIAVTLVAGLSALGGASAGAVPDDTAQTTGIPTEFCKLFPVFCG